MARNAVAVRAAREMLASDVQVGLFGYNHVPLTTGPTDSSPAYWPSRAAMEEALAGVASDWRLLFGAASMPHHYSAPYGELSLAGIRALTSAFPRLLSIGTSVATPRMGRFERVEGVYVMPASSEGYLFGNTLRRRMSSAVLGEGVWIHALDADDVLDPGKTSGRTWPDLLKELDRMYAFARRHYPWLRFGTMDEIRRELERLDEMGAEVRVGEEGVAIRAEPGVLVRLRTSSRIARIEGAEEVYRYDRADCVVIRMREYTARVTLR